MAGKVIVIAQQKGGAGKTTLAIQLAVAWQQMGKQIAMIDVDPQGSLTAWRHLRDSSVGKEEGPGVDTLSGWRLSNRLSKTSSDADIVVVDSPPHAETDAKAAVRAADLVLLPIQPTMLDLWATAATLALAEAENTKALLVLNRVPPRSLTADAVATEIKRKKWPAARARLGNRQAFAASISEGKGVIETARSSMAGKEVEALAREVLRKLR
ncbi:MAG: ParA family partition ATPase [Pseudomonadota bacterium]